MKLFNIAKRNGKLVTHFDSHFWMTGLVETGKPARINGMFLDGGDIIGFHNAVMPQLMIVIEGAGFVRNDHRTVCVKKGDAVLWGKGENHETFTETGLTALTVESEKLDLVQLTEN